MTELDNAENIPRIIGKKKKQTIGGQLRTSLGTGKAWGTLFYITLYLTPPLITIN